MKYITSIFAATIFLAACTSKEKPATQNPPAEKEAAAKEETAPAEDEWKWEPKIISKKDGYTTYGVCYHQITLPSDFRLDLQPERLHTCACDVYTKDGYKIIDLFSMAPIENPFNSFEEMREATFNAQHMHITYKTSKNNWVVVSGTDRETGNTIYWKRIWGDTYLYNLTMEYPATRAPEIEPHIATISASFKE